MSDSPLLEGGRHVQRVHGVNQHAEVVHSTFISTSLTCATGVLAYHVAELDLQHVEHRLDVGALVVVPVELRHLAA